MEPGGVPGGLPAVDTESGGRGAERAAHRVSTEAAETLEPTTCSDSP